MSKGDTVFYRQKLYKVVATRDGWILLKRNMYDPMFWVHETNVMLASPTS